MFQQQQVGPVALRGIAGPLTGQTLPFQAATFTVGRENGNTLKTDDSDLSVSRSHARFLFQNGRWFVENITTNNRIIVNYRALQPKEQCVLNDQDKIFIGTYTFLFCIYPAQAQPQAQPFQQQQQGNRQNAAQGNLAPLPPLAPAAFLPTERAGQPVQPGQPSLPSIEVSTNTNTFKRPYPISPTQQALSIGRDPLCDVVINEPVVSAHHFQIVREQNQFVLVHPHPSAQRTTNGFLFQGKSYAGTEHFRHVLRNGDVFRIGNDQGTLVTLTFSDGTGAAQAAAPEIQPIPLGAARITIGRHPDNNVVLTHPQVSAHHARIERDGNTYRIIDSGSTNHVFVNGQRVSNYVLKLHDVIRIGPYELEYIGTQLVQRGNSKSIRIDVKNLWQYGDKKKVLLNDISLVIPAGKFVAVVGGSGAGKSTLMDALNGVRPARSGQVLYNGQDYYRSKPSFSTQLGYVPQFDIIHKNLTVERALYYTAKMRLPSDTPNDEIKNRIDEVLTDVDMRDRRRQPIHTLSGGQQKRVSIALELLSEPNVLFLDEPTSGLDPGLDRKMMLLLRTLADKKGQTIVLVTHATNNISNCDLVCFLAPGGHLAYYGPPDEAKTYFGVSDFADIYGLLETEDGKQWESRYKQSLYCSKYVTLPLTQGSQVKQTVGGSSQKSHPWKQFRLQSLRYIELLKNDGKNLAVLLLQAPIIAIILWILIKYMLGTTVFTVSPLAINAEQTLFIMAFVAVFFGCNNAAREIVKEEKIYRRERMVNLGIAPYLLSKMAILGILSLLQSAVLTFTVNAISHFHGGVLFAPVLEVYIALALTSLAGMMLGLMISSRAANVDQANSIISIILAPQIIFSGVIFELSGTGAQIVGGFFATRWAMIAAGSSIDLKYRLMGVDSFSYQHTVGHVLLAWVMLVVMIVVFGCLTALFLKQKDSRPFKAQ
jgi:ABC-type multidrug transport system ATPase subunit/pSer/pThr/pTyr-binding forkhead associated (FHA) protein/ABC-type multidrug transport system permease subunit